jgi:endo-1,4-beta-xylanase
MRVTRLLSAVALLPLAFGQLNTLAKAKGLKYFGSATDNGELSNTAYTAILKNSANFGQITPGNTQKWVYTEPSNGGFSFTQGDVITSFAQANNQLIRCHNLVWYNELPSWGTCQPVPTQSAAANAYKSRRAPGRTPPLLLR